MLRLGPYLRFASRSWRSSSACVPVTAKRRELKELPALGGSLSALSALAGSLAGAFCYSSVHCEDDQRPPTVRRVKVARVPDFPEGELRQVRIPPTSDGAGEGAILLTRVDGQFYATGASCSHYSAPLAEGVAARDRMHVVCPWHNAAFDIRTGQPVRGAGLQAIPTYKVTVESEDVIVDLPRDMEDFVAPNMVQRDSQDSRVFVVLGGGAAGVAAADALRQEGYTGRIVLISEEKHLPYDRPVLSKNLGKASDPGSLSLRDQEYFDKHEIEIRRSAKVEKLDAASKTVHLTSKQTIRYDAAVVATGARPRELPIKGAELPEVLALRTPEDAQRIAAACSSGRKVVVIGSSFIGMELAATLRRRGCEVTVLGMEQVPFERVLGTRLGIVLKDFFESKGVKFMGGKVAAEIRQSGSSLQAVLKTGEVLHCDSIVVGVGVVPNADFVEGAQRTRDGSLLTDECLKTSADSLFAAGDVCTYKCPGGSRRVEHWDVATSQGRIAAKNMLGKGEHFDQTPFFWTSLFGKNLRYVGHCTEFDELVVDGDLKKLNFVAYYCLKNEVKAVATMSRDPVAVVVGELMRMRRMPSVGDLKSGKVSTAGLALELKRG
ncbi:AIFM3 [Symbiodinium natans]|uniref:AIFM3 protein n=1 Tax=Symbiodinium natans TaxID=878477 RepID=A0A812REA6_9DINO|nr:AIFM3 [Symbiodinium natans]